MQPKFLPFSYTASDGLQLAGRKYGWDNHDPVPVLCLAGLTRNSDDFDAVAQFLTSEAGGRKRVIALDYRGRGASQWDKNWRNYNILTEADDVVAGLTAIGTEHVHLLGTSRGGLIAMVLAASRPALLRSVILNDIGPELNGPGLVRIKRSMESAASPKTLDEAARLLQLNNSAQFPQLTAEDWKEQANLIYVQSGKKLTTSYDPKILNGLKAINLDARLATLWPQFKGLSGISNLLIHGEKSDLLTKPIIERMRQENSRLQLHTVPNEGHAPLLKDTPTLATIAAFVKAA